MRDRFTKGFADLPESRKSSFGPTVNDEDERRRRGKHREQESETGNRGQLISPYKKRAGADVVFEGRQRTADLSSR